MFGRTKRSLVKESPTPKVVATFPFEKRQTELFSELYRPMVTVSLWSPLNKKWRPVKMLIDTGADYTILPKYFAMLLGLDLAGAPELPTQGIGGEQRVIFYENLRVKIGKAEREIPVGFIPQTKAPALLGRHLFLETFFLEFIKNQEIIFKQ